MRFRSDAERTEFPSFASRCAMAKDGAISRPAGSSPESLPAGETVVQDFTFAVPAEAVSPRLVASYRGWLDYLVPGQGNPMVQRRLGLAI
ncbi:MAG: hypothetical protein R2909_06515 [Gemmatimonadales bacterium]